MLDRVTSYWEMGCGGQTSRLPKIWRFEALFRASSAQLGLRFSLLETSTSRGLEGCWNLICVVSRQQVVARTGPTMLVMLALDGCWDLRMRFKPRVNAKYTLWAILEAVNTSIGSTCTLKALILKPLSPKTPKGECKD